MKFDLKPIHYLTSKNPYLEEHKEYYDKRAVKQFDAKFRELILKKHNHLCPIYYESLHNGENRTTSHKAS